MQEVKISQCMIVKNEERNIERALWWGKGIVSEQIVVDTGSTDRTVEIANRMGAKVYKYIWEDDFAAAKNYAISQANYDWIAFLDADEYMDSQEGEKLIKLIRGIQNTNTDMIITSFVDLNDKGGILKVGTHCRIFRSCLKYQGRIHEALISEDGHRLQATDMTKELTIFHTGYSRQEKEYKKGRNQRLILRELEKNPDSFELWGYLGTEYISEADWKKAEEAFRKAISLMPEDTKGNYEITTSTAMLKLLGVLIETAEEKDIMEIYQEAVKRWPKEADYDYIVGRYFAGRQKWSRAESHLKRALAILETYGTTQKSGILFGELRKAYELLAMCCYNSGNLQDTVRFATILLREDPYLMSTAMLMLSAFSKDGQTASMGKSGAKQVAEYLGNTLYDFSAIKDRIFILKAAMTAGWEDFIVIMRDLFTTEELDAVDSVLKKE